MLMIKMDKERERDFFIACLKELELTWNVEPDSSISIVFDLTDSPDKQLLMLCDLIVEMWVTITVKEELLDRIQNDYYYQNTAEIEQIYLLATEMIMSNQFDSVDFINDLKDSVRHHFRIDLTTTLYDYQERVESFYATSDWVLDEMVARAIDEKKLEEMYQALLHTLREFARHHTYKLDILHVLQGDSFTFYLSNGRRLRAKELQQAILDAELLPTGFDETELNVTPILALAPKWIHLYGNDPSEKKTVAVHNIFEERVIYKPIEQFPFEKN
ncbi:putative sporulation protein YtxC [Natronobacillus azotifigens]|uniref:Sporulation protein YtxC n=1 Tax=Natronobacillus azotifigens TaxID=472978 RepID=A0A9J6RFS6_9BACI|nr:sporulation protein YtxC [Natronobacillus azotifigens]MCZ0704456.1 sporulation protein YtxC [Natronobacillus azotifigens]